MRVCDNPINLSSRRQSADEVHLSLKQNPLMCFNNRPIYLFKLYKFISFRSFIPEKRVLDLTTEYFDTK